MEKRNKHIRVTKSTKSMIEQYREQEFDTHRPIGAAIRHLLDEVSSDE